MNEDPRERNSLLAEAGEIMQLFESFYAHLTDDCDEGCRALKMHRLSREMPWLYRMLKNEFEHPDELVLW